MLNQLDISDIDDVIACVVTYVVTHSFGIRREFLGETENEHRSDRILPRTRRPRKAIAQRKIACLPRRLRYRYPRHSRFEAQKLLVLWSSAEVQYR